VYVAEARAYVRSWGVWPWEDAGKAELSISDVRSIEDSPTRLRPELAKRMYDAGESTMGGCRFLLELRDGRRFTCLTGNAVDFLAWPPGVSPEDVVDLVPHSTADADGVIAAAQYFWCLYWDDDARR